MFINEFCMRCISGSHAHYFCFIKGFKLLLFYTIFNYLLKLNHKISSFIPSLTKETKTKDCVILHNILTNYKVLICTLDFEISFIRGIHYMSCYNKGLWIKS